MAQNNLSEALKKGYSQEELECIYALGRFHLENGSLSEALTIMNGLCEVAAESVLGWLGLAYIDFMSARYDAALKNSQQALKVDTSSVEAQLLVITCLLTLGDFNTAGSMLGEIGERIESQQISNPNLVRFFKSQLARYESRA